MKTPRLLLLLPALLVACGGPDGALDDEGDLDAVAFVRDSTAAPVPPEPEPRPEPIPPVFAACRADDDFQQTIRPVRPGDTDPRIEVTEPIHLTIAPTNPNGRLFVFLPGATARPADYTRLLRTAASQGYHAIGLAYVNDERVNQLCNRNSPPRCRDDLRFEIVYGVDRSPLVDIPRPDSIVSRLSRLLVHLGWTQYLTPRGPDWANVTVAGHSQGSGHAAYIARDHAVRRVMLFAGTEPSAWTLDPRATPGDRTWGFAHVDDSLFDSFPRSWDNLGAPGPLTDVDTNAIPYGGSHQLTTDLPPANGNAHQAPVADAALPMDGNTPVYRPVWCHMIDG